MAAYRRVYDSRHLQADCQEPGSAPELTLGNRVRGTFLQCPSVCPSVHPSTCPTYRPLQKRAAGLLLGAPQAGDTDRQRLAVAVQQAPAPNSNSSAARHAAANADSQR